MYQFRPITDDNLRDVAVLFKIVVRKTVTPDFLRRKYRTPWSDDRMWGFIAYEDATNKPVAVAAALPCRVVAGDRLIPAAQTMDTLTLPRHAGRGLMTTLLRLTTEALREQGTRLFFGFCNQNSEHVYLKKLGWQQLFQMECYLLQGAVFPVEALCRRSGFSFLWRFIAEKILEKYKLPRGFLTNALLAESHAGVLHDTAFFQYKTFTFNRWVEIAGTPVWLKFGGGLLVGDVQFGPGTDFDALLAGLRKLARRLGLRRIVFQVSPGTRLQAELARRLSPRTSWVVVGATAADGMDDLAALRFGYGDVDTF